MWSHIKELVFLWISNGYSMIYENFGGIRDPLKQNLTLQSCRKRNKDVSILSQTHINLDQIHHIRNNWLGAIFFSPGDSHTKGLVVLPPLRLEGVTEVDTDPKRRFVSFKVTPSNDAVLCVYALGIAPGNSCQEGVSLKDYKIICKIKMREMKTK